MSHRLSVIAAVVGLALTAAVPAAATPAPGAFPTELALPNGFQPEGIAIAGATAYFGSRVDGDIHAVDLRSGAGRTLAQGPGTASLGMKAERGKLWVAGGNGGDGRVLDLRTGRTLAGYQFAADTDTFVNDVTLTRSGAWFTDSRKAVLYRVADGQATTLPLTGITITPGAVNLNGITDSPDGRWLLAVQSTNGILHRIDPHTGAATPVDTGGRPLTNGDGLLRQGRTLYVVQNRLNTLSEFRITPDGSRAEFATATTDPRFDVPTTVAAFGNRLYLPNGRFTTTPTPDTPYTANAIRRP